MDAAPVQPHGEDGAKDAVMQSSTGSHIANDIASNVEVKRTAKYDKLISEYCESTTATIAEQRGKLQAVLVAAFERHRLDIAFPVLAEESYCAFFAFVFGAFQVRTVREGAECWDA